MTDALKMAREALAELGAAHAWLAFGECRAYDAVRSGPLMSSAEADAKARAAIAAIDAQQAANGSDRPIPRVFLHMPDGDERQARTVFTEWRNDDDLHVCVLLESAAQQAATVWAPASPHIRAMAQAVIRQLSEPFPREEVDLDAVGLLCRILVGGYIEGATSPAVQQAATVGEPSADPVVHPAWPSFAARYRAKPEALDAARYPMLCSSWRDWRDGFNAATPPAVQAPPEPLTYTSTQATNCAGCGWHKHTPLRIDAMGGYVCLTCIDKKLGAVLGEFGYPAPQEPLTDEQIMDLPGCGPNTGTVSWLLRFARAIERAHGIGAAAQGGE